MSRQNDLTMLGKALCEHGGLLTDLVIKLDKDPGKWEPALSRLLREEDPWGKDRKSESSDLLKFVKTIGLPKIDCFEAAGYFKVTPEAERKTAEIVIGYLSEDFQHAFLGSNSKVETDVVEATLKIYGFKRGYVVDSPIITGIDGKEEVETFLAQIYELLRRQGRGQQGVLLTNGHSNLFYIRDVKGVLWPVGCYWHWDYWSVIAYPIPSLGSQRVSGQVISP